jgi:DNA polymerase-3 subunit beta
MMDALKAISDENISMYLTNPKAPCFLKDEEMTYTYLVLPVNFMR